MTHENPPVGQISSIIRIAITRTPVPNTTKEGKEYCIPESWLAEMNLYHSLGGHQHKLYYRCISKQSHLFQPHTR